MEKIIYSDTYRVKFRNKRKIRKYLKIMAKIAHGNLVFVEDSHIFYSYFTVGIKEELKQHFVFTEIVQKLERS